MDRSTIEQVSHIRAKVADRIGASKYRTWFGDAAKIQLNQDGIAVVAPNDFVGNWIASNYLNELTDSAREVLGDDANIDVSIVTEANAAVQNGAAQDGHDHPASGVSEARAPKRRALGRGALRGNLENFVVGPSNRLAHAAAEQLLCAPGEAFKLMVVHGGCGLGKTHLLQGVCNGLSRRHPTLEWRYVSGEQFTNEFIQAVKSGNVDLFRSRSRNVDVLLIDDIHFLANKKATQKEFLHTFDAIDTRGKAVVLSSDRHPCGISTLSEPLMNRLISGMVVEIGPPDLSVRREILTRRSRGMKLEVPEEVIDFIAERVTRNVRELEGALYKLAALASLTRDPITLDLARGALNDHVIRTRQTPGANEIASLTGARFGVTRERICSRNRDRTNALARAVTMYLVRKHTLMSFPEIGRALGNKNHSTVLMATQRVEKLLCADAVVTWRTPDGMHEALLRGLIEDLEQEIGV